MALDAERMDAARQAVEASKGTTRAERLDFLAGLEGLIRDATAAARCFRQVRPMAKRGGTPISMVLIEMEAAILALRTGQHRQALALLGRAEGPLSRAGERMNRSTVFALKGRCLTRTGRAAEGLAAADRALAPAHKGDAMSQAPGASG